MATWFSKPITWKSTGMTLDSRPDNQLLVKSTPGPIELRALYDGFVVYRSKSGDQGNLELVLMPDKWPDNIQKYFNPRYPALAVTSGITELPPGRVVYFDLPKSVIKQGLHKLIFDNFKIYVGDNTKIHLSLDFIPDIPLSLVTLKSTLLKLWNSTPDPGERQRIVAAEIDRVLDQVLNRSLEDLMLFGLPVQGNDVLCSAGNATSPAEVTFEIRNLYGEPLNVHYYLNKIEKTPKELAPSPPFPAGDPPPPRFKPAGQFLPIRIPKLGGVEFNGMTIGLPVYESPIVWTHDYDPSTGSHSTSLELRPGANVEIPSLDRRIERRINTIWDTDHALINKHAEIFQVPCELILATIFKESMPLADDNADVHSIRLEEVKKSGAHPTDYEDLIAKSKTSGSSLTKDAIEACWKLAGLWATHEKGLAYEPRKHEVKPDKVTELKPELPVEPADKLGDSNLLKKITWRQLEEMVQLKPHLLAYETMQLPVLGKTKPGAYHYDLIASAANLGPDVARLYFENVGGVRLNSGKEQLLTLAPVEFPSYALPTNRNWPVFVDAADPTKFVKWEQLIALLKLLEANGVKNVPKAIYKLQPLLSTHDYSYSKLFAAPELVRILGITLAQAEKLLDRYFGLMTKDTVFAPLVGPDPKQPGVVRKSDPHPDTEYLTITELRAMSQIYPGRISIGVGQILIDTATRKVIPWVKKHFGAAFFTTTIGLPSAPPDTVDAMIPWLWTNLWENKELQIALIASYHKQNATIFWQPFEDNDDNKYKVGEMMTRFDFPRVAAAYNAGIVRKPRLARDAMHPDVDWGLHTFGDYFAPTWSAITFAVTRFDSMTSTDPKWARVRLRPDLETNSGMDAR